MHIILQAGTAVSNVEQQRMRGVQMVEVIMDVVGAMTETPEGALGGHTTPVMLLVVVLAGSRVIGCVTGLDVTSTILQVAQNVSDAKLLGRLHHQDRCAQFAIMLVMLIMGSSSSEHLGECLHLRTV